MLWRVGYCALIKSSCYFINVKNQNFMTKIDLERDLDIIPLTLKNHLTKIIDIALGIDGICRPTKLASETPHTCLVIT